MKKLNILIILGLLLISCSTIKEVPVKETVTKIEYRDRIVIDSIYQKDSVFVYGSNDTIFVNKYIYKYKYKIANDTISVFVNDTIQVPVEVVKEVNKTSRAQRVLIGIGITSLVTLIALAGIKIYKKIK